MFKDFDNIQKEDKKDKAPDVNPSGSQQMPNLEGLGSLGGDDPMFMNLLNSFAKDLLNGDP